MFALILILLFTSVAPTGAKDDYDPTSLVFPSFLHTMGIRKATKMHLMLYTRNQVKVRDPQGLVVVRLESWENPKSKKDDDEVTGYGVNSGQNIIVYNKSMTSLAFYGKKEKGIKRLNRPTAISANKDGDVYVADTGNHRIVRMYNPGQKLEFVKAIGGRGVLAGQLDSPRGIAMDSNDRIYVSDTGNHRIQVLLPDDRLHIWFGEQGLNDGQLWHPTGIAVTNGKERWSFYKDAFIAVIDLDGVRLQKFSLDGDFLGAVHLNQLGYSEVKLMYAAIDYYSNIWVTDYVNHCIHKFDRMLNHLFTFGRQGSGDKEFNQPRGITIYKRFGQVFVAEKTSAQYYWIGTDILDLQSHHDVSRNLIRLNFFLTEPSYLSMIIETPDGKKHNVFKRLKYFSGKQKLFINNQLQRISGTSHEHKIPESTQAGSELKSGKYVIKLKVEATYSSLNYFVKEIETSLTIN